MKKNYLSGINHNLQVLDLLINFYLVNQTSRVNLS